MFLNAASKNWTHPAQSEFKFLNHYEFGSLYMQSGYVIIFDVCQERGIDNVLNLLKHNNNLLVHHPDHISNAKRVWIIGDLSRTSEANRVHSYDEAR